ncbi:alpha-galactosidase, partial [Blautia sp. MSK22_86]|uniref:alpha-galactosidase n=1 Tax=Blautia sp. MSK22_86 TaxID=2884906 RepID=UPI001D10B7F6
PLVDAAEKAGCEYFVIDAGWYADGNWWDSVGEWQERRKRCPNGVREVTDYIRSKGMIPGVWLELEVMGINCKKA